MGSIHLPYSNFVAHVKQIGGLFVSGYQKKKPESRGDSGLIDDRNFI